MGDLFDGYARGAAWDEVFDRDGMPHPESAALYAALQRISADDLSSRLPQLTCWCPGPLRERLPPSGQGPGGWGDHPG